MEGFFDLHGDGFGDSIQLDGDRLLALAPWHDGIPPMYEGVWTVFDFDGSSWQPMLEEFGVPMTLRDDRIHLELDGDTVFFGHETWAPRGDLVGVGSVFAYDIPCKACTPDLDGDGALTVFDALAYLNLFETQDPRADLDGDGAFTVLDFLAFQDAFDAGCG